MADEPDILARFIAVLGLGLATVNTIVALRRDRRERLAALPIVSLDTVYEIPRRIAVDVDVNNPLKRPIVMTGARLFEASKLAFFLARRGSQERAWKPDPNYMANWAHQSDAKLQLTIEAESTRRFEGIILMPEELPSPLNSVIDFRFHFDLRDGSTEEFVRTIRRRL